MHRWVILDPLDTEDRQRMPRRTSHHHEYLALGRRLRELRRRHGWTQSDLAENAGLSVSYVAEIERGGRNPSLETLMNLAAALNVSAGFLVNGQSVRVPVALGALCEQWELLSDDQRDAVLRVAALFADHEDTGRQRAQQQPDDPNRSGHKRG